MKNPGILYFCTIFQTQTRLTEFECQLLLVWQIVQSRLYVELIDPERKKTRIMFMYWQLSEMCWSALSTDHAFGQ